MYRIDYRRITDEKDKTRRMIIAEQELANFTEDNPPCLSEIYTRLSEGGQTLLIALDEQEKREMRPGGHPFKWKILVRRDEWGEIPMPGDVVVRRIPINRKDRDSRPVSPAEINMAKINGSYDERFIQQNEYPVDPKGCIECTFQDAGYFLFNWGVFHKTNRGMTTKPEISQEAVKMPNSDNMKHVWYWRYSEVDADEYAALPTRVAEPPPKKSK